MMSFNTLEIISGYRIIQDIYCGEKTLVYKAIREKDQTPVILKLMQNPYPTFSEIAQFRHQYHIVKDLNIPGIAKFYGLEHYRNSYVLVMEDFGGIPLNEAIAQWKNANQKQELSNFISYFFYIALQVTTILGELHRDRIIHKDIKPGNILVNPDTAEVKIIDFSIASRLPREIKSLSNPNVLEGTLPYISPEQTGRMNRGIDYRSDFYSLGITFFEFLCGQLPFPTNDLMELVHCHIAKPAPAASTINPKIPSILSDIISKLMAKNAEDRYQSTVGLKHDLEFCSLQWQELKFIVDFSLGEKDISDHFTIPEKLYGRHNEVKKLLNAFDRVASGNIEMVMVAGYSGVGKTALVNEVHKPIVRQRGFFIKGKFDQFQRDIPFAALVNAFRDLIEQILSESDAQIQRWKSKILFALGEQGQIIVDVIPQLEMIIGQQPVVAELSGSAAQNRFNLLFQRFIQVFTTTDHPLVIFLDDLQWADAASLNFIQLLMSSHQLTNGNSQTDNYAQNNINNNLCSSSQKRSSKNIQNNSLLLIGAYRDNEVSQGHPLDITLKEIKKTQANLQTITLTPLTQKDLNNLIQDTLHCNNLAANPLTQMVFGKTKGNPFFVNQLLKSLHDNQLIEFNYNIHGWYYDIEAIKALTLTDDVVEFMAMRIKELPESTQEALKLAACIGNIFDLKTLSIVYQKPEIDTAADLWQSLLEGLVIPENDNYKLFQGEHINSTINQNPILNSDQELIKYKFLHDRVQQAAYFLISDEDKQELHLKIGQLLLERTAKAELEYRIFDIVNQFNIAVDLITDPQERYELAAMNLTAGSKALAATANKAALNYLNTGIKLLTDDSWETQYELTLSLHETAAQAAYISGEFEQAEQLIDIVLANAKTLLEQIKVYEVKIEIYKAQNIGLEAISIGIQVLKRLEVELPEHPLPEDIGKALQETKSALMGQEIEDLINLPEMVNREKLVAMNILNRLLPITYQSNPLLFPLIVLQQINISLKYGNCAGSGLAYGCYAIIVWNIEGNIDSNYKFGQLALNVLDKFNAKNLQCRIIFVTNTFTKHWKEHIRESLQFFMNAYFIGLETGDLEQASYSIVNYSEYSLFAGEPLEKIEDGVEKYHQKLINLKQEVATVLNAISWQVVLNLLGKSDKPSFLKGKVCDETNLIPLLINICNKQALFELYIQKTFLCYLFQEYNQSEQNSILAEEHLDAVPARYFVPIFYFYRSLILLALYSQSNQVKRNEILDQVFENQEKMQKWATYAPMNYLHKFELVEAEKHRVLGNNLEAMELYDRAIAGAKENEYIHEEALANELAAKFYLDWGKEKIAQAYLTEAYYDYMRWGAKAKVDDLAQRYSQLLASIIQKENLRVNGYQKNISQSRTLTTFSNRVTVEASSIENRPILFSSQSIVSNSLDLAAVIKASQALSEEIDIEQLLSTLMVIMMENAGASKCAIALNENNVLKYTAVSYSVTSTVSKLEFPDIPLEMSSDIPLTLIRQVKNKAKIIVIDNVNLDNYLANDDYIKREKPESILCMPIMNQGKFIGVLYLENNLTTGVFTHDRIEFLKLITTQTAISLKNAILYKDLSQAKEDLEEYNHTLEKKVQERTQELYLKNERLRQALQELQTTQTQLIQSEKMSSLGEMVAGIAHEINNPINFIHGNLNHASEYVEDLLDLANICQDEYQNSSAAIVEKVEEMDLYFMTQDLPKLLKSMKVGTSRIRNIVLSLRNFSRLDEAEMKPVDIHEGIDNTLMILQHRLKAKSDRQAIEVIKEYTEISEVNCYAGQLNQVFMNIISNAIDALEEKIMAEDSQFINPQIHITTELIEESTVKISIADNGLGIPEEVQQKMFNPFFTTKPVGSGTGLGLSISYQVIVDKHKGQLGYNVVPGEGTEFVITIPM